MHASTRRLSYHSGRAQMAAAAGVAAAVCSGLANGTWNLPTKPDAPLCVYAGTVWRWENIWFVANLLIPVFNTIFVLAVVGADVLTEVYAEATPSELWAIVVPSLAWGWGGVGFGQAIKRLGVALGTSIVMGIIVVIGTALPAVVDRDKLRTAQLTGVVVGVLLGIAGFTAGGYAGLLRDRNKEEDLMDGVKIRDISVSAKESELNEKTASGRDSCKGDTLDSQSFAVSMAWCLAGGVLSSMLQFAFVFGKGLIDTARDKGTSELAAAMPIWLLCFACNAFGHLAYSSYLLTTNNTWRLFWVGMPVKKNADGPAGFDSEDGTEGAESSGRRRVPTEPRFANTRAKNDWARTTSHSVTMCALMAVAMPFHIHTYGIAAVLMGDTGAVFAWPVVMSATVFTAQMWSVSLREFQGAPLAAKRTNAASLALLVASVGVVAVTGVL